MCPDMSSAKTLFGFLLTPACFQELNAREKSKDEFISRAWTVRDPSRDWIYRVHHLMSSDQMHERLGIGVHVFLP
jgi:hypothetical protein